MAPRSAAKSGRMESLEDENGTQRMRLSSNERVSFSPTCCQLSNDVAALMDLDSRTAQLNDLESTHSVYIIRMISNIELKADHGKEL